MNEITTNPVIPMRLQFFAEGEEPVVEETVVEEQVVEEPKLTAEEELAKMKVEFLKVKKAQEKAASEAADYKRKYNSTLTDQEQKNIEKAERDAETQTRLEEAEKKLKIIDIQNTFMDLGYSKDKALEAANAQYDGDYDTLVKLQKDFLATTVKAKEAEWLKNRPKSQTGTGEGGALDAFLQGFNS
jgi:hypothetical protein